jgi:hypothetical protein
MWGYEAIIDRQIVWPAVSLSSTSQWNVTAWGAKRAITPTLCARHVGMVGSPLRIGCKMLIRSGLRCGWGRGRAK